MAGRSELQDMLRELAQQQSALSQQQTALVQLQTESLRLQRLLIERAIGEALIEDLPNVVGSENAELVAPEPIADSDEGGMSIGWLQETEAKVPSAVKPEASPSADDSPHGEAPKADIQSGKPSSGPSSFPAFAFRSRAARYMQAPTVAPIRPVSRHDVDRLARLYETGDAAHLVLNFGQYLGATLVQVAQMDPEYVHQLALSAQRPEVRAAARQMVIALEEVAAHKARPARSAGRRPRSTG